MRRSAPGTSASLAAMSVALCDGSALLGLRWPSAARRWSATSWSISSLLTSAAVGSCRQSPSSSSPTWDRLCAFWTSRTRTSTAARRCAQTVHASLQHRLLVNPSHGHCHVRTCIWCKLPFHRGVTFTSYPPFFLFVENLDMVYPNSKKFGYAYPLYQGRREGNKGRCLPWNSRAEKFCGFFG